MINEFTNRPELTYNLQLDEYQILLMSSILKNVDYDKYTEENEEEIEEQCNDSEYGNFFMRLQRNIDYYADLIKLKNERDKKLHEESLKSIKDEEIPF